MYTSIINYLEKTITLYPEKNAVIDGNKKLTFLELGERAKKVAASIQDFLDEKRNAPVAVYLDKSEELVVADIGVSYSGNFFMNLDIKTPKERIQAILRHIEPEIIIVDETSREVIDNLLKQENSQTIIMTLETMQNRMLSDVDEINIYNKLNFQIDTDPSCIINTSGSTGIPKGVILNHKSFFDFLTWSTETFELNEHTIIGSLSPSVFDIFVYEIWLMASKGSTIVILNSNMSMFPAKLLQQMKIEKVNFIFWVPSIMVNIANMDLLKKIDLQDLRLVWFAGEVFPTKQFNYWRKYLPQVEFANLYGPIEITLDCTYIL